MKLKDSIIIILVFIIAVVIGVFTGVKISEVRQDNNDFNQDNVVDNKKDNNKTEQEEQFNLKEEYITSNTQRDCSGVEVCSANIKILDSKNMILFTGENNGMIEYTKGTYEVVNDELVYTRKYNAGSDSSYDNTTWVDIDLSTVYWPYSGTMPAYTVFELDKVNNTIKLKYYGDNIVNVILK